MLILHQAQINLFIFIWHRCYITKIMFETGANGGFWKAWDH
jgi:hypothetical protein